MIYPFPEAKVHGAMMVLGHLTLDRPAQVHPSLFPFAQAPCSEKQVELRTWRPDIHFYRLQASV